MATTTTTSTAIDPLTGSSPALNPLTGSLNTASTTPQQTSVNPNTSASGVPSVSAPTPVATTTYDPTNVTVDPSKQTVQGQLTGILANNSPLMQQATAAANESSNNRGLLNSSMAVGAAQNAVISNALPIAEADSNTYNTVASQNTQAANAASSQNTQATNQNNQFNTSQNTQVSLANLDSATKQSLADIQANYNIIMQANSSAGQLYQQAVKNITDITNSTSMDAASKQAAISQQMNMLGSGMKIFGAMDNMNLGSLLDFNTNGTSGTQSGATPAASGTSTTSSMPATNPSTGGAASYSSTSAPAGFPTSPNSGQVYRYNGALYQYTGSNLGGLFSGLNIGGTWTKI